MSTQPQSFAESVEPSFAFASPGFSVSFGISGLHDVGGDMLSGGFYAMKVKTPSARFPLLLGVLESAVGLGIHCALVCASNPEDVLARLDSYGRLNVSEAVRQGRVHIFSTQEDFSKKMFRFTADRFVQELEEFDVVPGSVFIFDQADELLSLHDSRIASEQLQILSKWFYKRQTLGLLTMSLINDQHMATLNSLMDYLSGIATLGAERDGLELTHLYWQSSRGVAAARTYRLVTQPDGMYEATEPVGPVVEFRGELAAPTAVAPAQPSPIREVTSYFYVGSELEPLQFAIEGQWVQMASAMDMLLAARGKSKAMLLVDFEARDDLWEIAKTVHALRKGLGTSIQILVREVDLSIADEEVQLLLRCGANTVIGPDVSLEDYPELLSSFVGQIFPHRINPNFAALVGQIQSQVTPPTAGATEYGYDGGAPSRASGRPAGTGAPAPFESDVAASANVFDVNAQVVSAEANVPRVTYNYGKSPNSDSAKGSKPSVKATRRSFASSS